MMNRSDLNRNKLYLINSDNGDHSIFQSFEKKQKRNQFKIKRPSINGYPNLKYLFYSKVE